MSPPNWLAVSRSGSNSGFSGSFSAWLEMSSNRRQLVVNRPLLVGHIQEPGAGDQIVFAVVAGK